jgi:glycosyltransferase involved in cell wall biosynthesis
VSFCIPTLNNEDTIEACLKSITDQTYPNIEIIIIDGHSKDKTIEIASKYTTKIVYDTGTYGSACQTGIEYSKGLIIGLFDSDIVIPHNKWLINAVQYFNYNNNISTIWPINIAPPNGSLTTRLYFNHWKIIIEDRIKRRKSVYGGGNSLFLKKCLIEIGGVDRYIHWGADFDWAQKLKLCGYQVIYLQDPLYHNTMRSLKQYSKKQFVGAKTFTKTGFKIMDLTIYDMIREQIILGINGMIVGLLIKHDTSWLLYPIYIMIRLVAYVYTYIINVVNINHSRSI